MSLNNEEHQKISDVEQRDQASQPVEAADTERAHRFNDTQAHDADSCKKLASRDDEGLDTHDKVPKHTDDEQEHSDEQSELSEEHSTDSVHRDSADSFEATGEDTDETAEDTDEYYDPEAETSTMPQQSQKFSLRRFFMRFTDRMSSQPDQDTPEDDHSEAPAPTSQRGRMEEDGEHSSESIEEKSPEGVAEKLVEMREQRDGNELFIEKLLECEKELAQRIDSDAHAYIVELSAAHPTGLAQLYAGRPTKLSNLVRESRAYAHCKTRAKELMASARRMEEHHGVGSVYLAIGSASWNQTPFENTNSVDGDGLKLPDDEEKNEPAGTTYGDLDELMAARPLPVKKTGPALLCNIVMSIDEDDDVCLTLDRSLRLAPELDEELRKRGLAQEIHEILRTCHTARGFSPVAPLEPLRHVGEAHLIGFDVYESLTIGQFIHPARVLIDDIRRLRAMVDEKSDDLPQSQVLLRALAGDSAAQNSSEVKAQLPEPVAFDRDPEKEHGVGDLDSDQHNALDAVASGAHVLLDAPPGSETLTTVAAMLVDCALEGKTVAYVAADKSKSTQLLARLDELGLSDIAVDVSHPPSWREEIPDRLRQAIRTAAPQGVPPRDAIHEKRAELIKLRHYLAGYSRALHSTDTAWGVSAYDALQVLTELTSIQPGPRTRVRLQKRVLSQIAADGARRANEVLDNAYRLGIFSETRLTNPWSQVQIDKPEDVGDIVNTIRDISIQTLPQVRAHINRCVKETGLSQPETLAQWDEQLEMLRGVRSVLDVFVPEAFERSAADMVIATALPQWRKERALHMKASTRRRLIRQAKALVRPARHVDDLHVELVRIQEQRKIWRDFSQGGGYPVLPTGLEQMLDTAKVLSEQLRRVEPYFNDLEGAFQQMPIRDVVSLMDTLAHDESGALKLSDRVEVLRDIRELGLTDLVEYLRIHDIDPKLMSAELDLAWWASALTYMMHEDRFLSALDAHTVRQMSERLRLLDRDQVDSLAPQAAQSLKELKRRVIEDDPQGASYLLHEVGGTSRPNLPTIYRRCALASYIIPVRVMPPVLVPQLVDYGTAIDVVVCDGIENTDIAELIPTIARARQVVVIGDMQRERKGALKDLASLLPHMTIPPKRSRTHELVAAFLAAHGYGEHVMSVPVPRVLSTMDLTVVDGRGAQAPGAACIESSQQEVDTVVDMVLEAARENPDRSLGVIALNSRHAQRIREAIIGATVDAPWADKFFSSRKTEPFIVVDAAHCATIRRDAIIIAVGFAKTPHGRVLHSFGNISGDEGRSILVDALQTARRDIKVVCSFEPDDVDRNFLGDDAGAHMLIDLLESVKNHDASSIIVDPYDRDSEEDNMPDQLLVDLAERLFDLGLTVVPNVGSPMGMKIPLAIGHPHIEGELLLAVLTDNPDYVSEQSLRRRERHWKERLEDYGWNVHMVYSTGVFSDPQREAEIIVEKVLDIVDERVGVVPALHKPLQASVQDSEHATKKNIDTDSVDDSSAEIFVDNTNTSDEVDTDDMSVPQEFQPEGSDNDDTQQDVELQQHLQVQDDVSEVSGEHGEGKYPPVESESVQKQKGRVPTRISDDFINIVGTPTPSHQGTVTQEEPALKIIEEDEATGNDDARTQRPKVAPGLPVAAYTDEQLRAVTAWIDSDGKRRTTRQLVKALYRELELTENTNQVRAVLKHIVSDYKKNK
ncbi:MAG: hypothetical protein Q4P66_04925 [Actinomycetaceae bacterium]|nr:hypothetical protein [Actinomycetaceae bacterium]MDO5746985.1 hypothetical protein [Actinomycetaceae bacterium]